MLSIIEDWRNEGIILNGPSSESDIIECETKLGFRFPDDCKQFYKACNGFAERQMDSKMLSLWPLEMIKSNNVSGDFIAFADYNVNGSQIGYVKSQEGVFHDYDREKFCNTFAEFIDHWKNDTGVYI